MSTQLSAADPVGFRKTLQGEFLKRCRQNPRYSLRGFARALAMDPSDLSKLLRGKRAITPKAAREMAGRLGFDPSTVVAEQADAQETRSSEKDLKMLLSDTFSFISDWYYYAILELLCLDGLSGTARVISTSLGLSIAEAQDALERLERLGMVARKSDGSWKKLKGNHTTVGIPGTTGALKKRQRQVLEKAIAAMDEVPPELRDQSCMTMSVSLDRLPEAKKRIKNFRRELCSYLEAGPKKEEVFELCISLFPLSRLKTRQRGSEE